MILRVLLVLILLCRVAAASCTSTDSYSQTICAEYHGANGLLHYWRMNATSGTTENDVVNDGPQNGTYHGTVTLASSSLVPSITDKSMTNNGTDSYMSMTPSQVPSNTLNQGWSIELWFTITSGTAAGGHGIISTGDGTNGSGNFVIQNGGTGKLFAQFYTTNCTVGGALADAGTGQLSDGVTYYVALTSNGKGSNQIDAVLYKNGVSVATVTNGAYTCGAFYDYNAGRRAIVPDAYTPGKLDEIALYNVQMSAATVFAHYNAGLVSGTVWPYTTKRDFDRLSPPSLEPKIPLWMFAKSRGNKPMPFYAGQYR